MILTLKALTVALGLAVVLAAILAYPFPF